MRESGSAVGFDSGRSRARRAGRDGALDQARAAQAGLRGTQNPRNVTLSTYANGYVCPRVVRA